MAAYSGLGAGVLWLYFSSSDCHRDDDTRPAMPSQQTGLACSHPALLQLPVSARAPMSHSHASRECCPGYFVEIDPTVARET